MRVFVYILRLGCVYDYFLLLFVLPEVPFVSLFFSQSHRWGPVDLFQWFAMCSVSDKKLIPWWCNSQANCPSYLHSMTEQRTLSGGRTGKKKGQIEKETKSRKSGTRINKNCDLLLKFGICQGKTTTFVFCPAV